MLESMRRAVPVLCVALLPILCSESVLAQAAARRVPMDSARAAQLYVSTRPEDHPVAQYEQHIAAKARTDSVFAARSRGVMD
jgi:hypothetical protein